MILKKTMIGLAALTFGANACILSANAPTSYLDLDDQTFINETIHRIENYSQFLGNEEIYKYQNKEYRNENEIYEQILSENPIEQIQTTSNPNKIISNYEYGLLNGNKIYSTDISEYVRVYKNSLGKVVLPTCGAGESAEGCVKSSKSAKERALDSYVNPGLTRKKYSYLMGDEANWFDNLEEAERDYINKSFYIKEGLFYEFNGKYFNAFNNDDLIKLKNVMPNKGLFTEGDHLPSNSGVTDKKPMFGEVETFKNQFKEELRTSFNKNINSIFGNYEPNIVVKLESGRNSDSKKQWFTNLNFKGDISAQIYTGGDKIEFQIPENLRDNGWDLKSFMGRLTDVSNYGKPYVTKQSFKCGIFFSDDKHDNYDFKYSLNGVEQLSFTITTEDDIKCAKGYTHINLNNLKTTFNFKKKIRPNLETKDPFLKSVIDGNRYLESYREIDIDEMLNQITLTSNLDKETLLFSILDKKSPSNWNREVKDYLFEDFYEKCYQFLYGYDSKNSPVKQDWIYGSSKQFSLVESQMYYRNEILYKEIFPTNLENDNEKVSYQTSAGNFETTWSNWRDNYFYLHSENNNPDLKLQKMYFLTNNEDQQMNDFSDLKGDNLGNTIQEAKAKQSQREEKHIRTRLFIYDINGELVISDDDEETAYENLRKKISMESKFISKIEAKNLHDLDSQWKDIISDGIYNVYRFKTKNETHLYFSSFSNAFRYYVDQFSISNSIQRRNALVYRYTFKFKGIKYTFDWSENSEIYNLALEINQIRKLN